MFGFVIGTLAGGLAMWFWGDQIRGFADSKTRGARKEAVNTLKSVEKTAESVLDRTKDHVSSVLQAGQDAVNPSPRIQQR